MLLQKKNLRKTDVLLVCLNFCCERKYIRAATDNYFDSRLVIDYFND